MQNRFECIYVFAYTDVRMYVYVYPVRYWIHTYMYIPVWGHYGDLKVAFKGPQWRSATPLFISIPRSESICTCREPNGYAHWDIDWFDPTGWIKLDIPPWIDHCFRNDTQLLPSSTETQLCCLDINADRMVVTCHTSLYGYEAFSVSACMWDWCKTRRCHRIYHLWASCLWIGGPLKHYIISGLAAT